MGRKNGEHYLQTDRRWRGLEMTLWDIDNAIHFLTRELQWRIRGESSTDRGVRRALRAVKREALKAAATPGRWRPTSLGGMNEAGCWLVSLSNILLHLDIDVGGEEPTPANLLVALQDDELLTVTGHCIWPGIDLMHMVTGGRVHLSAHECYPPRGVRPIESEILRTGLRRGRAALVNVTSHDHSGGPKRRTHYVAVIRRIGRSNWSMMDPACPVSRTLLPHFKKVYQVWLYKRAIRRTRR